MDKEAARKYERERAAARRKTHRYIGAMIPNATADAYRADCKRKGVSVASDLKRHMEEVVSEEKGGGE